MELYQKDWALIIEKLNDVIHDIYIKRNRKLYTSKTKINPIGVTDEILDFCHNNAISIERSSKGITKESPTFWKLIFNLPSFNDKYNIINYRTILMVSKLERIFCIINLAQFKNIDPCGFKNYLDVGKDSSEPFTSLQEELCDKLISWLSTYGYNQLQNFAFNMPVVCLKNVYLENSFKQLPDPVPEEMLIPSYYDVFFHYEFNDLVASNYAQRTTDH